MVKIKEIYDFLNFFAPFETSMDFDNTGILIGDKDTEIKKALVCLDITAEVLLEAKNLDANLIISHHPIFFENIKKIAPEHIAFKLILNQIDVICAHTNLDMAPKGVNFCLAEKLKLKNTSPLSFYKKDLPLGLIGFLEKAKDSTDFAKFVENQLGCKCLKYMDLEKKIKKVAVCSGSGGDLVENALEKNCDALVVGEIKHHQVLNAFQNDLFIVETGHFSSENIVIEPLVQELNKKFVIEFIASKINNEKLKSI